MARAPLLQESEMVPPRGLILLALLGCAAPPRAPAPSEPVPEAPQPQVQNTPDLGVLGAEDPGSPPVAEPQTQRALPPPPGPDPLQAALDLLSAGQEARGIAGLRHELAEGERSLEAALALASYLAARERLAEALAAIEVALTSHPEHSELALARAELLRDLGQREEAAGAMRHALDLGSSHPRLWFGLAELQWLLVHREQALEALRQVQESDHPWVQQEEGAIQKLALEVQNNTAPVTMSARDLFGDLRGAPRSFDRYRALRVLTSEEGDLRRQAVTIALNDRDPSVRVQALRLGDWSLSEAERLSRGALTDTAASVRAAAIPLARRIDPQIGGAMVLEAIARENDPDCFRLMHEALQEISGVKVFLPPGAAADEKARTELVAEWRKLWSG